MNIGLILNAKGKLCLVHDEPFDATPLWVGYHVDHRKLEIIFDTGGKYPVEWEATDEMNNYLQKVSKIFIMRLEGKRPVEGYDTMLFRLQAGRVMTEK